MLLSLAVAALSAPLSPQSVVPVPAPESVLTQFQAAAGFLHSIDVFGAKGETVTFALELDGNLQAFQLEPFSVRSDNFKLVVQLESGELVEQDPGPVGTYAGYSLDGTYRAWVGLDNGQLSGTVQAAGATRATDSFEIVPLGVGDGDYNHFIFRTIDDVAEGGICGTDFLPEVVTPEIDSNTDAFDTYGGGTIPLKVAELGIDCDFEFYQKNQSSVTTTMNDVETVIMRVQDDHYNDLSETNDPEINYEITQIIVRTTSNDPYSSFIAGTMLDEVRSEWLNNQVGVPRDHASLFSGKNVNGSVIGIAWLSGICSSLEYSMVESRYTNNMTNRASLSSHELGHNWSANHCDGTSSCHIMCSGLGGCNGVGGDFGPISLNAINQFKQQKQNCLDDPGPTGGTAPVITSINPSSVEAVVIDGGGFQIIGTGFTGTNDVQIDGVSLSTFPAEWSVIDDTTIAVILPVQDSLGTKTVEVTNSLGSDSATVDVVLNAAPTLELENSDPSFLFTVIGANIYVGSQPDDIVVMTASGELIPSNLPGLVSLDIGNNFTTLIILGSFTVDPTSGYAYLNAPLPSGLPIGLKLYAQAAVISAANPTLPAEVTNVQSGTVLL